MDTLYKLGIETVGQFLSLPSVAAQAPGRRRGDSPAGRGAAGALQPLPVREAVTAAVLLDYPRRIAVGWGARNSWGLLELEGRHENRGATGGLCWTPGRRRGADLEGASRVELNQIPRLARLQRARSSLGW